MTTAPSVELFVHSLHGFDTDRSFKALFVADLSCYIKLKQPLYALQMKACRSIKPVIAQIVCASPRMAPLFDGSAAAISFVTSTPSS